MEAKTKTSTYDPPGGITLEEFNTIANNLLAEVGQVLVGQEALIHQLLITLLAGGNALLEGVPGLGKTMLVRTLAQAMSGSFSRIQFTPDLMPADIVGTMVLTEDENGHRAFRYHAGPVFANLLLADEINRATPRTQSALLEAMQERRVTVSRTSYQLPSPFFVLATQNPIEMEGTYPLPEAQLDRFFFKINVNYPTEDELMEISRRTTGVDVRSAQPVVDGPTVLAMQQLARQVPVAEHITRYAARLVLATHPHPQNGKGLPLVNKHLLYGASPRGMQALILAAKVTALLDGREAASAEDVRSVAIPALRHRLILNYEAQAEGADADAIVAEVVQNIPQK
jgi:MoxR-like ATPase